MAAKPTTVPRWARTAAGADAANLATPSSGEQDTGYTNGQNPVSSGKTNWLFNWLTKWLLYLQDAVFVATAGSGLAGVSGTGDGAAAGGAFTGGATSGAKGVTGQGTGTGPGVAGTGGASGPGGSFQPASLSAPVVGAINFPQVTADPSAPQAGDVWLSLISSSYSMLKYRAASSQNLICWSGFFSAISQSGGGTQSLNAQNSNQFSISVTDATAFTISPTAPAATMAGSMMTIRIKNTSGGAMGAITWNALFKMTAFTNPATGFSRSITFMCDGTNWIEISRNAADIPN